MSLFEDGNKTDITKRVTAAVCFWMDERGFKPMDTEITVDLGWIADVAGAITPTETELQDLKLIPRKPQWKRGCDEAQYQQQRNDWYALRDQTSRLMTALVEVKTSRSDFIGDRKWTIDIPTDLAWLAYPAGLVSHSEWPDGWGILEYQESRDCVVTKRPPRIHVTNPTQQLSVVFAIACRQDNRDRYAQLKEALKRQRDDQNERRSLTRINDAIRMALAVARGRHGKKEFSTIDEVFEYFSNHEFRCEKPPKWMMTEMESLWRIAADIDVERYGQDKASSHSA